MWGGANTLAQALWHVRATRPAADLERIVSKLRVYTISDQDDAGPWLRREFPTLHYIATPGDHIDYHLATWTGHRRRRVLQERAGADFTTVSEAWVNEHMRKKGPLGAFYPLPCCIIEGDTPSFLSLINNGLASYMNPTFGGWGGRYVWRQPWLETRPYWTNARASRDTVTGVDGKCYTSDQATIWRWREAFQHDFAARMDWTINDVAQANHNPDVVVNGVEGKAPLMLDAKVGTPVDAGREQEQRPRRQPLRYQWFFYPRSRHRPPQRRRRRRGGGPAAPPHPAPRRRARPAFRLRRPADAPRRSRVTVTNGATAVATVTPNTAGVAHVILAVTDDGTPSLTSYRRSFSRSRVRHDKPKRSAAHHALQVFRISLALDRDLRSGAIDVAEVLVLSAEPPWRRGSPRADAASSCPESGRSTASAPTARRGRPGQASPGSAGDRH